MKLVLGTAALGLPYGLPVVAGGAPALVEEAVAAELIRRALAAGVDTFDTAPAYGLAEERLGRALDGRSTVWTKLGHDRDWSAADAGLDASCRRLARNRIDLLQVHNWTPSLACDAVLDRLAGDPRVVALGCSTYGTTDALAAVRDGRFRVVQVEWSLLNQAVVDVLGGLPRERGVRLAVRSVLLQGVLAGRPLPSALAGLDGPRRRFLAAAGGRDPAEFAIAAAIGHPAIDHVLVGLDAPEQLAQALAAQARPVDPARHRALHLGGQLVDPRTWSRP